MRFVLLVLAALVLAERLPAQTSGQPVDEVRLARSAAPAHVSDDATVMVLKNGRYLIAAEGSNEVTCIVARSRPGSLEPICYDAEASRTILPIEIRRVELRLAGTSDEEIDRIVSLEIGGGQLKLPVRPALSYMMSSGQILVSDEGRNVGPWLPHLMLYIPYITGADLGLYGPPSMTAAAVFDEGLPTAHVVIAVREFVDP